MPISGLKNTADTTKATGNGTATTTTGRTRPAWLRDTGKTTTTTEAPWKKNATSATAAANNNANGVQKEAKLQSREIKVPVVIQRKTSIVNEPVVKPKPKEVKVTVPEDNYETSSSEYEEVTDTESEEEEEEETASESESEKQSDDESKNKLPIQVKLKPVERPAEVKKSPSVDRAGKFVKPALKKVPTLDKLDKPKPPPVTIPERKPLRRVEKPLLEEPKESETKEFVRPPLRKVDSTTKKRK